MDGLPYMRLLNAFKKLFEYDFYSTNNDYIICMRKSTRFYCLLF